MGKAPMPSKFEEEKRPQKYAGVVKQTGNSIDFSSEPVFGHLKEKSILDSDQRTKSALNMKIAAAQSKEARNESGLSKNDLKGLQ